MVRYRKIGVHELDLIHQPITVPSVVLRK